MPAQHGPPPTPLLHSFLAGGARIMQTDAKKSGGVEHQHSSHSKSSRSHQVEVVLARIFAKQRGYLKQKSLRHADMETMATDSN
jgi:hypothetical protein